MKDPREGREPTRFGRAISERLTYANVMATIAVFGMLAGGGAYAASEIGPQDIKPNAVRSEHIKNGQVKTPDLANDAVVTRKLGDGAVTTTKLAHGAVTTGKLGDVRRIGTVGRHELKLRVNGSSAFRLEPAKDFSGNLAPNAIGGSADNSVLPGAFGATISGGGSGDPADANRVTDFDGTIGGGAMNRTGDGDDDLTDGGAATIAGGANNVASGPIATVGGGTENDATGGESTIAGGIDNEAAEDYAAVGGGLSNSAIAEGATVAGGRDGRAFGRNSTVAGGSSNGATGIGASAGGGEDNEASGLLATIPGGVSNFATGDYGFAAGRKAAAQDQGAFVWADSLDSLFRSTAPNQFSARATGGVRFVTGFDPETGDPIGAELAPGSGSWSVVSDSSMKTNLRPVDQQEILRGVARLPISTWSYRAETRRIRHIGPMAQDFHRAFGVGENERTISTVDSDGVSLAAIQGLYDLVRVQQRRIQRLEARVARVERR